MSDTPTQSQSNGASSNGTITPGNTAAIGQFTILGQTKFIQQPDRVVAGTPFATAVVVAVVDSKGNILKDYTGSVDLAFLDNYDPNQHVDKLFAQWHFLTTISATKGIATFTGISIGQVGSNFILIASGAHILTSQSKVFDVAAPKLANPPASISIVSGNSQKLTLSKNLVVMPLQVMVLDSAGKPVSNAYVTFSAPQPVTTTSSPSSPIRGLGGKFGDKYTTTVTTTITGTATISNFNPDIAGAYNITATVEGVKNPAVFNLINFDLPSAPDKVQAITSEDQVTLTWVTPVYSGSVAITGYNVYEVSNTGTNHDPTKLNTTPVTTNSYVVKGLSANVEYLFMISAINAVGESGMGLGARVTLHSAANLPTQPTLIQAVVRDRQVTLYFAAGSADPSNTVTPPAIMGFNLYRADNKHPDNTPVKIGFINADKTTYTDNNLTDGVVYTYTLTAFNTNGESTPSNSKSASLEDSSQNTGDAPDEPSLLSATIEDNGQISLSWQAPQANDSPVTGYNIYRIEQHNNISNVPVNELGPLAVNTSPIPANTSSYVDTASLKPDTTYYYFVRAINTHGEGNPSNIEIVKTHP